MPASKGRDLLLTIQTAAGPPIVYTVLGSQQGASITRSADDLDASSKDSEDYVGLPGRRSSEISCDALLLPTDAAYVALEAAYLAGTILSVKTTTIGGRVARTASVIITELGEEFPDNEVSTCSISLKVTGAWA